jgi:ABC-2 type transport system permease protein
MGSLKAGFHNELLLMAYRKKTILFLIFSALLPVVLAVSFHSLQPIIGLMAVSQSFPIEMLSIYTLFLIPLFIFLTSADLFPNEVSSRTLKLSLLRPITRFQAFTAKMLALGTAIAVLLVMLAIVTTACYLLSGNAATAADLFSYGKAYFAGFISMIALSALFVLVSQFFQSAAGFLVFSIVLYAAAKLAPFFAGAFSAFSLTSYTDWYVLWLSHTVSTGRLISSSLFVLSGFVLFFSLGYLMFERREA